MNMQMAFGTFTTRLMWWRFTSTWLPNGTCPRQLPRGQTASMTLLKKWSGAFSSATFRTSDSSAKARYAWRELIRSEYTSGIEADFCALCA